MQKQCKKKVTLSCGVILLLGSPYRYIHIQVLIPYHLYPFYLSP